MRTNNHRTAQLGDLIVAAFDKAALSTDDPKEASHLATRAVQRMLVRARELNSDSGWN